MYRVLLIILVFLSFGLLSSAQSKIDSLEKVLATVKDDSLKIRTYLFLRGEYHRTDPQVALEYTIKAVELAKKATLQTSLGEAIYRKGTVLFSMRHYQEAENDFDKALAIFSTLKDKKNSIAVKIDLARLYQEQSKIEEALNLYLEVLPITKEVENKNAEARIYNFLGGLYKVQKQYDKAIENFELALSIVKELNFTPGISACLTNLAGTYDLLNKSDIAISYHQEALKLKYENGDKLGASRVLNNMGIAHNNLEQYDKAENCFREAHQLAQELDDAKLIAFIEYGLVVSTFYKGNFKQSIEMSNSVLACLDSLPDLDLAVKVYRRLSYAYKEIGAFEKAYTNASISNSLSDSLLLFSYLEI